MTLDDIRPPEDVAHLHRQQPPRLLASNRVRSRLRGRSIRVAAIILEPRTPHWPMRVLGIAIAPTRMLAFSETGQHFRIRPDGAMVILRHLLWRARNFVRLRTAAFDAE